MNLGTHLINSTLFLYLTLFCQVICSAQIHQPARIANQVIVQIGNENLEEWQKKYTDLFSKLSVRTLSSGMKIVLLDCPDFERLEKALLEDTTVVQLEYNYSIDNGLMLETNDPLLSEQYNFDKIRLKPVWNTTTGGQTACGDEIVVAISEVRCTQYDHPDLFENIWINKNEVWNDGIDNDQNGYIDDYYGVNIPEKNGYFPANCEQIHGTGVAGIIGAVTNNELGIAGVNWKVKSLLLRNGGTSAGFIESYNYIWALRKKYNDTNGQDGAYICATNLSAALSGERPEQHPIWCALYDSLGKQGIVSVAGTDNFDLDVDKAGSMPSLCNSPYLIIVNNVGDDDQLYYTAKSSRSIDLSAPGVNVLTTVDQNGYDRLSGSSFSSPTVCGAVALLYSLPSTRFCTYLHDSVAKAPLMVINSILGGVDRLPHLAGKTKTGGRLNVENSLSYLKERFNESVTTTAKKELVFPNPTGQKAIWYANLLPKESMVLSVFDAWGNLVFRTAKNAESFYETIDLSGFESGLYLAHISTSTANKTVKVLKQ